MKNKNKSKSINKKILFMLVFVVILSISINIFFLRNKNNNIKIISENIEEQVTKIVELSTVKYNYTDVVSYESFIEFSGLNIPFTNKQFIAKYKGYIKAGVDFNDIKIEAKDDMISISIPEAKILDNVIMEESIVFFDEKDGLFNKLNYDELYEVLTEEKEKLETQVIKDGILNEAQKNTEDIVRLMLLDSGMEDKQIEIITK